MYIIPYYTYPLSGPQNEHFNCIMCAIAANRTYCIYIHFWQWVFSNHIGPRDTM